MRLRGNGAWVHCPICLCNMCEKNRKGRHVFHHRGAGGWIPADAVQTHPDIMLIACECRDGVAQRRVPLRLFHAVSHNSTTCCATRTVSGARAIQPSRACVRFIAPMLIDPNPPAFDTAAASCGVLTPAMGAWINDAGLSVNVAVSDVPMNHFPRHNVLLHTRKTPPHG